MKSLQMHHDLYNAARFKSEFSVMKPETFENFANIDRFWKIPFQSTKAKLPKFRHSLSISQQHPWDVVIKSSLTFFVHDKHK